MTQQVYTIQELVDLIGVSRRTIYFYTQQGILPPPQGAGLAARYTQVHLLRLRLIPLLRERGLRLDDIRQRLSPLDESGLAELIAQQPAKPPPAPMVKPSLNLPQSLADQRQAFIHYALPCGITLVVPSSLPAGDRPKVEALIAAAVKIWSDGWPDRIEN
jgi:DNA-binding transcriptional MerR regulator